MVMMPMQKGAMSNDSAVTRDRLIAKVVDDLEQKNSASFATAYTGQGSASEQFRFLNDTRAEYERRLRSNPSLTAIDFYFRLGGLARGQTLCHTTELECSLTLVPESYWSFNQTFFQCRQDANTGAVKMIEAYRYDAGKWKKCFKF